MSALTALDDLLAHLLAGAGLALVCPCILYLGVTASLRFQLYPATVRTLLQRILPADYVWFAGSLALGFGLGSLLYYVLVFQNERPYFAVGYGMAGIGLWYRFQRQRPRFLGH